MLRLPTDANLPQDSKPDPEQKFGQALEKISSYAADPCSPPDVANQDLAWDEYTVFNWAAAFVTQELNAPSAEPVSPKERATKALDKLERISTEINKAWPDENRFHSQVLDIPPALVVKMTIRMQATFSVLGIPDESSRKPNREWHEVGRGSCSTTNRPGYSSISIHCTEVLQGSAIPRHIRRSDAQVTASALCMTAASGTSRISPGLTRLSNRKAILGWECTRRQKAHGERPVHADWHAAHGWAAHHAALLLVFCHRHLGQSEHLRP